jgi:hypothetical protein
VGEKGDGVEKRVGLTGSALAGKAIGVDFDEMLEQLRLMSTAAGDLPVEQLVSQVEGRHVGSDAAEWFHSGLVEAAGKLAEKLDRVRIQLDEHEGAVRAALATFQEAEDFAIKSLNGLQVETGMNVASDVLALGEVPSGPGSADTSGHGYGGNS